MAQSPDTTREDAENAPEATGERLMPDAAAGELVHAEHVARYAAAARLAPGRRTLDAACGEGYGTRMLAAAGARGVIGVDIDPATVAHARRRHRVDVRQADVGELPFAPGDFDLVVSFETIEHVADPHRALSELARVLGDDGVLIVSTPNAREYLVDNPFHVRELEPDEFMGALGDRFATVHPLYQQNFLTSAVLGAEDLARADADARLELETRKVAGVEPGRELYSLAVCGPTAFEPPDLGGAVLAAVYEAHELAHRYEDAVRTQHVLENRAREVERHNAELHATLDRIADSLSWRITKPLRTLKSRF
jgi:SAM-dependent methyltransferase